MQGSKRKYEKSNMASMVAFMIEVRGGKEDG